MSLDSPPLALKVSWKALNTETEVEMQFAWVPPGSFQMGGDVNDNERPIHEVILSKGFYMGIYAVTEAQWKSVMDSDDRLSPFLGDDYPVRGVSWDGCQVFCGRMRGLTHKAIRLPTEAEWEYACRAGTTTDYYSGNGEEALDKVAWYRGNSNGHTHPVSQKAANGWGLYDMHGNVHEWCSDWFGAYSDGETTDPTGPDTGAGRVVRGGWCKDTPRGCRAAFRYHFGPASRPKCVGLRVCFHVE